MKKYFLSAVMAAISLMLVSWGVTGHRVIGKVAENHLTPKAKAAIEDLLGDQTLADVSTWADEVRGQPEYRQTAPWHFLNLPLGLSYDQFQKKVEGMGPGNVCGALIKCEHGLIYPSTPRGEKIEDFKFIVHFVGDIHQPMHISRAEDKGGNTIQLNHDGNGTNLHALWDTKLLEHQGLSYIQLAEKYDHVSATQIKQWQSDPLVKWIWESYEISSKLYAEVDGMKGRTIDNSYYEAHIGIIQERIEKAGIRLAGVLNEIFKGGPINGALILPQPVASSEEAAKTGMQTVCDKVYNAKVIEGSEMTLLNLGGVYPDQKLTIMIRGNNRSKFKVAPEIAFQE